MAQKLGFKYIDTGMIYRAGCLKMLQNNVRIDDLGKILDIYRNLNVRFETNDNWKMFLDDDDVSDKLHTPEISRLVSIVSAKPEVREIARVLQRQVAKGGKIVMGGRDIGSEIFPNSKFKFFLTASVEERARRRFNQLKKNNPSISYGEVLQDIIDRDKHDSERAASPMRIPKDAIIIDNTNLSIEETVKQMLGHIRNYA